MHTSTVKLIYSYILVLVCIFLFSHVIYAQTASFPVTAEVPASPTDFPIILSTDTDTSNPIRQGKLITYTISYGNLLASPSNLTIEADWSYGMQNNGFGTIQVVSLVNGSVTKAYNTTEPIIDILNRKITWTIPTIPANTTNKLVSFQLRAIDTNLGKQHTTFHVRARLLGPGTSTAYQTLEHYYMYDETQGPTTPPTPITPTTTPLPTLFPGITLRDIDITSISTQSASITASLSQPGIVTILYGTSPQRLTEQITTTPYLYSHSLMLDGLSKGVPYFFRIIAKNRQQTTTQSALYTFTTASVSPDILLEKDSLVITGDNTILYHPSSKNTTVVIPQNTSITTQFTIQQQKLIQSAHLVIPTNPLISSNLQRLGNSLFTGSITPSLLGNYVLTVRIFDTHGNLFDHILSPIKVTQPFTIREANTNLPVEQARIILSIYDPIERVYKEVNASSLGLSQNIISEKDGIVPIALPANDYQAKITATGYNDALISFTIGNNTEETYPRVHLVKKPFSLLTFMQYIHESFIHSLNLVKGVATDLSHSYRFFTLSAVSVVFSFVFLTLMSFTARTRVALQYLHTLLHPPIHHYKKITGSVVRQDTFPLAHCQVIISETSTGRVQRIATTNKRGEFSLSIPAEGSYQLTIIHPGFIEQHRIIIDEKPMHFVIESHRNMRPLHSSVLFMRTLLSFWFEILLVTSLVLEILLGLTLGWEYALPFIVLSVVNIGLWVSHILQNKHA